MLPKKERLSRTEFNRFFSIGKRYHSPTFQIVHAPHSELHVSVVVSKKIARLAVERNKIRRRIYDIVRHYRSEIGAHGVFIFLTKGGVGSTSYAHLKEAVYAHMDLILKRK